MKKFAFRRTRKPLMVAAAAGACLTLGLAGLSHAQQQQNFDNVVEHILHVQGDVYMLVGAGGNTTLQIGKEGVLVVDTQFAPLAPKIAAEIKKLSDKPIRYVINTHYHGDHTGGNEAIAKLGARIAGGNFAGNLTDAANGADIIAHENVLNRLTGPQPNGAPALPFAMLPTDTYFTLSKDLYFNGEAVQLIHPLNAHTDGDSIVFFRRSDVISAGDIFTPGGYPVVDLNGGGSINGLIAALNKIIDLTVPADKQEGGTYVIPGHGHLCDEADIVEYRDMATIIRDRFQDAIKKGQTFEQVKAAKLTRDYDPLYGATTGFWTTDRFVEAVYKSLSAKK